MASEVQVVERLPPRRQSGRQPDRVGVPVHPRSGNRRALRLPCRTAIELGCPNKKAATVSLRLWAAGASGTPIPIPGVQGRAESTTKRGRAIKRPPWNRLCRATSGAPLRGPAKPVGGGPIRRLSWLTRSSTVIARRWVISWRMWSARSPCCVALARAMRSSISTQCVAILSPRLRFTPRGICSCALKARASRRTPVRWMGRSVCRATLLKDQRIKRRICGRLGRVPRTSCR